MSDFFGKIKSGAGKVAFEAEKMNRLNKAKGELEHLKKQVEELYTKLGQLYYNQHHTLGVIGPAFDQECADIDGLEKQIDDQTAEIEHITNDVYTQSTVTQPPAAQPAPEAAPAAPARIFCSNCGRELTSTAKFCPDCGTKM